MGMKPLLIPGLFTESVGMIEPVEETQIVSKSFVDTIYIFMMRQEEVIDLKEWFDTREMYKEQGASFDEDLLEIFIEHHLAWKRL